MIHTQRMNNHKFYMEIYDLSGLHFRSRHHEGMILPGLALMDFSATLYIHTHINYTYMHIYIYQDYLSKCGTSNIQIINQKNADRTVNLMKAFLS